MVQDADNTQGRNERSSKQKDDYLKNTFEKFSKYFLDRYIYLFIPLSLVKYCIEKTLYEKCYGNSATIKTVRLEVRGEYKQVYVKD